MGLSIEFFVLLLLVQHLHCILSHVTLLLLLAVPVHTHPPSIKEPHCYRFYVQHAVPAKGFAVEQKMYKSKPQCKSTCNYLQHWSASKQLADQPSTGINLSTNISSVPTQLTTLRSSFTIATPLSTW
jgi:hypothetical protein